LAQQKVEPPDQAAKVVADRGKDGIGGIAVAVKEAIAAHPMFGFEMADHRLRGASTQLAVLCSHTLENFSPKTAE
jgi:hypothetical protein